MKQVLPCLAAIALLVSTAARSEERLSTCPPDRVFYKIAGKYWCVEKKPHYYGGGQAKETGVLKPEQSSGPSPFGPAKPFVEHKKKGRLVAQ
jgi:hypothetical protein